MADDCAPLSVLHASSPPSSQVLVFVRVVIFLLSRSPVRRSFALLFLARVPLARIHEPTNRRDESVGGMRNKAARDRRRVQYQSRDKGFSINPRSDMTRRRS